MKETTIIQALALLAIMLVPLLLLAQPASNPYGEGGRHPDSAPIDGGYGAKKIREKTIEEP